MEKMVKNMRGGAREAFSKARKKTLELQFTEVEKSNEDIRTTVGGERVIECETYGSTGVYL